MEAGLGWGEKLPNPTELANVWQSKELHSESWQLVPETQGAEMMSPTPTGPVEGKSVPIYTSCDSGGAQSPTEATAKPDKSEAGFAPAPEASKEKSEQTLNQIARPDKEASHSLVQFILQSCAIRMQSTSVETDRQAWVNCLLCKYEDLQKTCKI